MSTVRPHRFICYENEEELTALSLANTMALNGKFDVFVDGTKVFAKFKDGSTGIVWSQSEDSINSTGYDPEKVEVYSPIPTIRCIAHGGDKNYYHYNNINGNESDVFNFPVMVNRFDVHEWYRCFGGLNLLNGIEPNFFIGGKQIVHFLEDFDKGFSITINSLQIGFAETTNNMYYGAPLTGPREVKLEDTFDKTLENLVNYINGLVPNNLPFAEIVDTGHYDRKSMMLTNRTSIVAPGATSDMSIHTKSFTGSTILSVFNGLGYSRDADMFSMGEWSGPGFNIGLGHFHLEYNLELVENEPVEKAYIMINDKFHSMIRVVSGTQDVVLGSTENIKLIADGKSVYKVDVVKEYKSGEKYIATCYKTLPNRQKLEFKDLNITISEDEDVIDVYKGFTLNPGNVGVQILIGEDTGEFLFPSSFSHITNDVKFLRMPRVSNYDNYRYRTYIKNGLIPDSGLFNTNFIGCTSDWSSDKKILKMEQGNFLISSEITAEAPRFDAPEYVSIENQYGVAPGKFTWGQNIYYPTRSPYTNTGDNMVIVYKNFLYDVTEDDFYHVNQLTITASNLIGKGPIKPEFASPLFVSPIDGLSFIPGTDQIVINNYLPMVDGNDHIPKGKALGNISLPDGNITRSEYLKRSFLHSSMSRLDKTEDSIITMGLVIDKEPEVLFFKGRNSLNINLPTILPSNSKLIRPSGLETRFKINQKEKVHFSTTGCDKIVGVFVDSNIDSEVFLVSQNIVTKKDRTERIFNVSNIEDGFYLKCLSAQEWPLTINGVWVLTSLPFWTVTILKNGQVFTAEHTVNCGKSVSYNINSKGKYEIILTAKYTIPSTEFDRTYNQTQLPGPNQIVHIGKTISYTITV